LPVLSDTGETPGVLQSGTDVLNITGTAMLSSTSTVKALPPSQLVLVKKTILPLVPVVPLGQLGQLVPSLAQDTKKQGMKNSPLIN